MGSVSSANAGVTDVLQMLSNLNSPVLSSPAVTSALEKAPTADIVQLSMAATQLENVDAMFGISNSSNASTNSTIQTAMQSAETQALLFGTGETGSTSGSLFNLMG